MGALVGFGVGKKNDGEVVGVGEGGAEGACEGLGVGVSDGNPVGDSVTTARMTAEVVLAPRAKKGVAR